MKRFILALILLFCAFAAFGFRGEIGRTTTLSATVDSFDFVSPIAGSITREYHDAQVSWEDFGATPFYRILPDSGYGFNKVRLNYAHFNPASDITTNRYPGSRDSSMWYWCIQYRVWNNGICDTVTENQNGVGGPIPYIAFCGALTPPPWRMETAWATYTSTNRATAEKHGVTTTRAVMEGDSIACNVFPYVNSMDNGATMFYAFGWTSYNSQASGAPPCLRSLHIQYCDTAYLYWDMIKFATSLQKDAAIVYAALDAGPRYTIASNAPWGNRTRCDLDFSTDQEEDNTYLYRGDRVPVVSTLAAAMTANTSTFLMAMPAGWDSAHYKTYTSYEPQSFARNQGLATGFNTFAQILLTQVNQGAANIGRITWCFNGSILATSPLDTASGVWRITLNNDGDDGQPDSAISNGGAVVFAAWPWMKWEGLEDFQLEGYYGTGGNKQTVNSAWVPMLGGELSGQLGNNFLPAGIDSIGTSTNQQSQHFTVYRAWTPGRYGVGPLRIREGFEFWKQKTTSAAHHAAEAGKTWRHQSVVCFYTHN